MEAGAPFATASRPGSIGQALAADRPDQPLVPGEVPDHPRDRVHRLQATERVLGGHPSQTPLEFGPGEAELVDAWMRHGGRTSEAPRPIRAYHRAPTHGEPCEPRMTCHPTSAGWSTRSRPRSVRNPVAHRRIASRAKGATTTRTAGSRRPSARSSLEIGEDPDRQGLAGTPERVHRMYTELTAGYHVDPDRLINGAIFDVDYSEMVVVRDIPFYSLCEHHLLPFFGTASVAYIPRGRVVGLSKIPRIVEMYARRLQVQERLTQQIAEFLQDRLDPQGVGVVMEATHLCAAMRGVRKPGTIMTTRAVLGLFRTRDRTRAEFFAHLEPAGRPRLP